MRKKGDFVMNEINEIILSLLEQQIALGNPINGSYIEQLVSCLLEQENLQKYAQIGHTYTSSKGILYLPNTKTLNIKTNLLKENSNYLKNRSENPNLYQYLYITKIILNEIEYIKQLKDCEDKSKNDIQTKILRISYSKYINMLQDRKKNRKELRIFKQYWETYTKYTSLAPERRLASIYSYDVISNLIDSLGLEEQDFINKNELHQIILAPYEIARKKGEASPTIFYLRQLRNNKKEIEELLTESQNLYEIEKFRLGLPNQIENSLTGPKRKRILILPEKNCYSKNSMLQ